MRVAMQDTNCTGWGIASTNLKRELAKLPEVPGVTIHSVSSHLFEPLFPGMWDEVNIGYAFFEDGETLLRTVPTEAAQRWDHIVVGSNWCHRRLLDAGYPADKCSVIIQGVDHDLFKPQPLPAEGFTVFSGGQFSLRKGQDIVLLVVKEFMDRHEDVRLIASWGSQWIGAVRTMDGSPFVTFQDDPDGDASNAIIRTVQATGIDMSRVTLLTLVQNTSMPQVYAACDIGFFPNRCEAGNNMVMCEFMACGRAAVASDKTGHADVITPDNAYPVTRYNARVITDGTRINALWPEPDPNECLDLLEAAYRDREETRVRGEKAAADMKVLRWDDTAARFHALALALDVKRGKR